jgi:hypothetical protein
MSLPRAKSRASILSSTLCIAASRSSSDGVGLELF